MRKKLQRQVIIPIEMVARELDAKVMLAASLVAVGYRVILADKHLAMNYALSVTDSIFLSIWGAHEKFSNFYEKVRQRGNFVVAMDEEGFITMGRDIYVGTRLTEKSLKNIDLFLCLGNWDASLISNKAPTVNTATVGNPRVDVLLERKKKLAHEGAGTILFASPFGFANHFIGGDRYLKQLVDGGVLTGERVISLYTRYLEYQEQSMRNFMDFAKHAATFLSGEKLIYRCHPAEDSSRVDEYFAETTISVSRGTALIDDLARASIVVHNFCTVGLEAQILGKKTLAYTPLFFGVEDEEFLYRNSVVATDIESGMRELLKMMAVDHGPMKFNAEERIFLPSNSSSAEISQHLKTRFGTAAETKAARYNGKFLGFLMRQWVRAKVKGENPYFQSRKRGMSLKSIQSQLLQYSEIRNFSVKKLPLGDFFVVST